MAPTIGSLGYIINHLVNMILHCVHTIFAYAVFFNSLLHAPSQSVQLIQ